MTKSESIELFSIYRMSDIEIFEYIRPFCDDKHLELVERLIWIHSGTKLGLGYADFSNEEREEYYDGKWELITLLRTKKQWL